MNDSAVAGKINMLANEIQALHRGWNKLLYQYSEGNKLEKVKSKLVYYKVC